jgi:hypothetical protein
MRIEFERTGGFAGVQFRHSVDSDTLPDTEKQALDHMLQTAGFFNLPSTIKAAGRGADRFQYKLSVVTPDRQHSVVIDESAVPDALKPLLAWLTRRARTPKS